MTDSVSNEDSSSTEVKKPVKEVQVVQDQGLFEHDTGDVYDGYFEIKKKDKVARMHGPGTYTTAEGDTYIGMWESDRLGANEEVSVVFNDGSRYGGPLRDWNYSGFGKYYYPDGSILNCEFVENAPVGFLNLTDPNGHTWLGKAALGFGWFEPVNHFYEMLEKTRESVKVKRRRRIIQEKPPK